MQGKIKQAFQVACQVGFLTLASLAGNAVATRYSLPIPGSIIGMLLVFILLRLKVVRLPWLEAGANWLLGELLLFFVPAAVGIMQYQQAMARDGTRILLVIAISTLAVMTCTGLAVEYIARHRGDAA